MVTRPEPSPEVEALVKAFCDKQREKYGSEWKKILGKEIAAKTAPVFEAILKLTKKA
jgi:hypothetical protein